MWGGGPAEDAGGAERGGRVYGCVASLFSIFKPTAFFISNCKDAGVGGDDRGGE
jgi:hypothetical protein